MAVTRERSALLDLGRRDLGYYANPRADVVEGLPRPVGAVLDVGCGSGALAPGLRDAGATRLVGIEVDPPAAARATESYDRVLAEPVEAALDHVDESFDTILCLDVLEHLVDPAEVLLRLGDVARPDARLQVSVPNVRHYSVIRNLLTRGTFGYAPTGICDSSHLRWFTRRDMRQLLGATGWTVERESHSPLERWRLLHRFTAGALEEFLVSQWYFLARRGAD